MDEKRKRKKIQRKSDPDRPRNIGVDMSETDQLSIQYVPLGDLLRYPRNPKDHDLPSIVESFKRWGMVQPISIDDRTGMIYAGHGRLDTLFSLRREDKTTPPAKVTVNEKGEWLIPTLRGVSFKNEQELGAYIIADNRLTEKGGWDDRALLELSQEVGLFEVPDLQLATGFELPDLEDIAERVGLKITVDERDKEMAGLKEKPVSKRKMPIDGIFTVKGSGSYCCLAVHAGLKYGTQSGTKYICPNTTLQRHHEVCFIDNEWHGYDHRMHVEFVARYRPKYATVRDIMTPQQCKQAGVEYFPPAQILEWAKELEQYAENVMIIPKYDCLDIIPDRFMIGYSVPTSYGGTPLPLEYFRGRRIHLLGGSWKKQLRLLALLGEDIVSLDFNECYGLAKRGQFIQPDGRCVDLREVCNWSLTNPAYVCTMLSFGAIASAIREIGGLSKDIAERLASGDEKEVLTFIERSIAYMDEKNVPTCDHDHE